MKFPLNYNSSNEVAHYGFRSVSAPQSTKWSWKRKHITSKSSPRSSSGRPSEPSLWSVARPTRFLLYHCNAHANRFIITIAWWNAKRNIQNLLTTYLERSRSKSSSLISFLLSGLVLGSAATESIRFLEIALAADIGIRYLWISEILNNAGFRFRIQRTLSIFQLWRNEKWAPLTLLLRWRGKVEFDWERVLF